MASHHSGLSAALLDPAHVSGIVVKRIVGQL
jgi:hypothetical protein